jgi:hypothetical protein
MGKILDKESGQWINVRKIIAVDYDGTIDYAGFPKTGKIDEQAVKALKTWRNKGNALILWTCRAGKQLEEAVRCCKQNGLEFDAVNDNLPEIKKAGFLSPKVLADYYIDDCNLGGKTGMSETWKTICNYCK